MSLVSKSNSAVVYNVVEDLQDYMLTSKNITRFNKDRFGFDRIIKHDIKHDIKNDIKHNSTSFVSTLETIKPIPKVITSYKPSQSDSLFWCFYILKYGYSKYEMEVGNQHFTIEKSEKFKYIDLLRKNKDILKINKIRPLSDLEDDLAHNQRISIKTFFALCILEKINILLVDKRKIYESITNDSSQTHVIHRNSVSFEHHIELNISANKISDIQNTYYKVQSFDSGIKSMSSYKVDELLELCKQLDINVANTNTNEGNKKKLTKKDIYELLVQNF